MNAFTPKVGGSARPLPPQNPQRVLLHATRFRRSADALRLWSETAKKCVDYFEGRQWNARDLAKLLNEKRPALTINKIKPLVELVYGYWLSNRTDINFLPGYDGTGTADIAAALSHVGKQISEMNQLPYVDGEVFIDGLLTGRGFWDWRLGFDKNLLGDVNARAQDPFSTYLDPDGDQYDTNTGNYIMTSRWTSAEEVTFYYGKEAAARIGGFLMAGGVSSSMPVGGLEANEEVTPIRRFGQEADGWHGNSNVYGDYFYDWIDGSRKNVRLVDIQHYVLTKRWFFVDLDTGSSRAVPDHWGKQQIEKSLHWARTMGSPLVVQQRDTRRVRWTHMVGDTIVFDDWSPYDSFTIVPFYAYFRRGITQGMVEGLIDAQDEVNKRRSARLNILGRSAAGGWMYPKGSLTAEEKLNLERYGSTPGVMIEYDQRDGKLNKPEPIQPSVTPAAYAQVEKDAEEDIMKIAGINEAAMGQMDQTAISGRALLARQRQAVIGKEGTMANWHRAKELCGRKILELIQGHMTEERIIRSRGTGNDMVQMVINQRTAAGVVNDVTLGSYALAIDEVPLSKSFLEAQFEELMRMKEMGMPIPDEFIIDASSIARKEELKLGMAVARQQQAAMGAPPPADGSAPPAGGPPQDPGAAPAQEPGAPPGIQQNPATEGAGGQPQFREGGLVTEAHAAQAAAARPMAPAPMPRPAAPDPALAAVAQQVANAAQTMAMVGQQIAQGNERIARSLMVAAAPKRLVTDPNTGEVIGSEPVIPGLGMED